MANKFYRRTNFIGGSTSSVDEINSSDLTNLDLVIVNNSTQTRLYKYDNTLNSSEDIPEIITPDDITGDGRFTRLEPVMRNLYSSSGNTVISTTNDSNIEVSSSYRVQARAGISFQESTNSNYILDNIRKYSFTPILNPAPTTYTVNQGTAYLIGDFMYVDYLFDFDPSASTDVVTIELPDSNPKASSTPGCNFSLNCFIVNNKLDTVYNSTIINGYERNIPKARILPGSSLIQLYVEIPSSTQNAIELDNTRLLTTTCKINISGMYKIN